MSILTYHEINSRQDNLFGRLKDAGVIHEGELYSLVRKEYVKFDNLFDFTKCDSLTQEELAASDKSKMELYIKELDMDYQGIGLTEEEKKERIREIEKVDYRLLPVSPSRDGGMSWIMNYSTNDLPAVAVERLYPAETFNYFRETEGHVECDCYVKNGETLENDKIFVHPGAFTERLEDGRVESIMVSGFRGKDGKYYDASIPFGVKEDVYYDIVGKGKFSGWAVVTIKPGASIALESRDGSKGLASAKEFKKFVGVKNNKVLKNRETDTEKDIGKENNTAKAGAPEEIIVTKDGFAKLVKEMDCLDNIKPESEREAAYIKERKADLASVFEKAKVVDNPKPSLDEQLTKSQYGLVMAIKTWAEKNKKNILFDFQASSAKEAMNKYVKEAKEAGFVLKKDNGKTLFAKTNLPSKQVDQNEQGR